jgi:hypothetical protein
MSEFPCPVEGCKTGLQRASGGSLADGVTSHLTVVHRIDEGQARALAVDAISTAHRLATR